MGRQRWEHAVLFVGLVDISVSPWRFEAKAWVDETEIYSEVLDNMFWSKPLADLAHDGWELVAAVPENALFASWTKGHPGEASRPVRMNFFLKRPAEDDSP